MKLSVLHVLAGPGGGAWGVLQTLARLQVRSAHVGIGLAFKRSGRSDAIIAEARSITKDVFVHEFPLNVPFASGIFRIPIATWADKLYSLYPQRKVVVHMHNGVMAGLYAAGTKWGSPHPIVATFHGIVPIDDENYSRALSWRRPLHALLVRRAMNRGVTCVAVSNHTAAHVERRYGLTERMIVIKNGVESPVVTVPAFQKQAKITACFVGELGHRKNWRNAAEAVAEMHRDGVPIELVICGDGPDRTVAEELTKRTKCIRYLGRVPDAANTVIPFCSFLLLPSRSEGLPLVVLEAFAAGVPAVATSVAGISEVIRPNENGILLQAADSITIRRGIEGLLSLDDAKIRSACTASHTAMNARRMAESYLDCYEAAIQAVGR